MLLNQIVSLQVQVQVVRRGVSAKLTEESGSVSTIAGIAALTIGVLAAAVIVVDVMTDHANAIPGPTE